MDANEMHHRCPAKDQGNTRPSAMGASLQTATSVPEEYHPQQIAPAQRRYTMKTIRLHHWPYAIFRSSRTPPGLYARQKWLQEASSPLWKTDFDTTVSGLFRGQSNEGLWSGSPIETIHRLFGLHLTVRTSNSGHRQEPGCTAGHRAGCQVGTRNHTSFRSAALRPAFRPGRPAVGHPAGRLVSGDNFRPGI